MKGLCLRIVGFVACLAIYGLLAFGIFVQIVMGDCDTGNAAEHAQCEAARSNYLLVFCVVTLLAFAVLVWAFFIAGRKKRKAK